MTIDEALRSGAGRLARVPTDSPRLEAELLLAEALGCERSELLAKLSREVTPPEQSKFDNLLNRRVTGEPVAYILGYRDFYRDRFVVAPGVLIPRSETEMLVEYAEAWIKSAKLRSPKIVDLGCGSGCLGLSLARATQGMLLAIDVSPVAVAMTAENTRRLALEKVATVLKSRVQELPQRTPPKGWSWGEADVVVANPPYIGRHDKQVCPLVKKFEPPEALFAEDEGFREIAEWMLVVSQLLRPGGLFLLEHGANQGERVRSMISALGEFNQIQTYRDLAGWDRMLVAFKNANTPERN
jgi:release factor glutamine methyltransferase